MTGTLKFYRKSDYIGSAASLLCLAHCVATPFLFAAHAGHVHGHHAHPVWWGVVDLVFIAISGIAVFWSARHTANQWVRYALWVSWALLTFVILNEKLGIVHLMEETIYAPSIALIGLHLYNRKYCQCSDRNCCSTIKTDVKTRE